LAEVWAQLSKPSFSMSQHVVANRDRALVDAENFLEVFTQRDLGNILLTGLGALVFSALNTARESML
jgi:hypothetical protein